MDNSADNKSGYLQNKLLKIYFLLDRYSTVETFRFSIQVAPVWGDFMFSVRFRCCVRVRRRKDFCFSSQNHLS